MNNILSRLMRATGAGKPAPVVDVLEAASVPTLHGSVVKLGVDERALEAAPATKLRGRVGKVSIVKGGEVSVVVKFGIDEPDARKLDQGALVELIEIEKAPPPKPKKEKPRDKPATE